MESFDDKVVVVTGAASGIGRALAAAFGTEGARVVLADIDAERLAPTAADLQATGIAVTAVPTDVRDHHQVQALAAAAVDTFGGVDILCNNAGIGAPQSFANTPLATWRWTIDVDLWGVVHGCRTFLPHLLAAPEAHILNTASMAGLLSGRYLTAYSVAKAGVVALSEGLRAELAADHPQVGVSVLCPSYVDTDILDDERLAPPGHPGRATADPDAERVRAAVRRHIATGRSPAEVAARCLTAIRENRPYVFTDRSLLEAVTERFDRITAALDSAP